MKTAFEKWLVKTCPLREEMRAELTSGLYCQNEMCFDLMQKYAPDQPFSTKTIYMVVDKILSNNN